jgi:hypothetical protein
MIRSMVENLPNYDILTMDDYKFVAKTGTNVTVCFKVGLVIVVFGKFNKSVI